ncbi:MAG: hypothetical protein IPJ40_12995 [Saprospirales bacterium]|nr:hypothetical protein [Saprospirales bacterium]
MKIFSSVFKLLLLVGLFQLPTFSMFAQSNPVIITTQVAEDYPNSVDLTLVAFNFKNLVSMQFVFTFDPLQVQYDDFTDYNLPGLNATAVNFVPPNSIHFSWISPDLINGTTLADGAPVCTIRFTPVAQGSCSFLFDLGSSVFPEFVNSSAQVQDYLLLDCATGGGILSGKVFADQDANCSFSAGESTLGGFRVQISSNGENAYVYTRANGAFFYPIQPNDETLTISVISPNDYWEGCTPVEVVDVTDPGANLELDLGMAVLDDCKQMEVELGAAFLRRCFLSPYHVSYCNQGTLPVEDAYVVVDFDPFLEVNSSTIPWSSVSGNAYTFPVGDLGIGECGSFDVQVLVSCEAELGQTHCSEAVVYPLEFCNPAPEWDGSQLSVTGSCTGDEVQFEIRNIGQQAMSNASGYIVIEDDMIKMMEPIDPLGPGESVALQYPATGATWRVEVIQVPDFPAPSEPSATVEACDADGDGNFSMGFVSMFSQDEYASNVSRDCQENLGSLDPNDKSAFPVGYRETHQITPETRLEYKVRFQNTGTDTAFIVIIRDTLSEWLDPASIRLQATSHPCDLQVLNDRRLVIHFPDILLPDSTTNEAASNGFVQFSIDQLPGNPIGEVIDNQASIYFDYNLPVITNEVFHTIGVDFVQDVSSANEVVHSLRRLTVSPNPSDGPVHIQLSGAMNGQVILCDLGGRQLLKLPFQNGEALLEKGALAAGLYWAVLKVESKVLGVGSVILK